VFYLKAAGHSGRLRPRAQARCARVLENKYYMDWFNEHVLAPRARLLGTGLWKGGDQA
jgi:NADH-quinone oxidoreductase subunit L